MRALACPASFKGSASAVAAATALGDGLQAGGAQVDRVPVADGGEGTAEVLQCVLGGEWREATVADPLGRPVAARWLLLPDGTAVVEAAAALGLPLLAPDELDPLRASSRGFGELIRAAAAARPRRLLLCLGGVATVDGGVGLREALDQGRTALCNRLLQSASAACDVSTGLGDAARLFGPQKGASPDVVSELERRLAGIDELRPYAELPGSGAAGGLGAALAALGVTLVPGAELVLEQIHFRERLPGAALAVTGEGRVDRTTAEGKAPAVVARACAEAGVRCTIVGGAVDEDGLCNSLLQSRSHPALELRALSGDPARTEDDLRELGEELARALLGGA